MIRADRSRLPALGSDPRFSFPAIRKQRLANGLDVWTVEQRELPVLTLLLLVPWGSASDPPHRPGLASLTGDMLDEGSGHLSAIDLHDALARIGAEFDTEVGADASVLTLTTLARFRERALALLADMVIRPRLDVKDFDRVRQQRVNRLIQLLDLPPAVAERAFARLLYGDHPYGHLPIGTDASLRAMALDEVVQFHRRTFRPTGATLIAIGDASHDELARACADAFGSWDADRSREAAPSAVPAAPPEAGVRLALVPRAGAAQSELRIGHVGVAWDTPDYHALLVLNMILGGQFVSRINLNLREEKGYTYGARTGFDFRRGRGPFVLQVSVQTAVTADAIRESLHELQAIRGDRPPTPEELDLARAALTRGYPRNFETAEQVARAASQLALYGLPDDYFEQFVACVSAVGAAEVTRAAERHLDPLRLLTLVVGDREAIEGDLGRLRLGDPLLVPTA